MVTGDLFGERAAIVFKQDEVPHVIQKQLWIEEAANDFLQLVFQQRPIVFVLDRFPRHESLFVGRQRTDSRRNPIADDQSHVVGQQVGDFVFVSLQLRVSLPHIGRFIRRVLQLDDRQRQAIDEDHDVGPASLLGSRHAELVDDQQVVIVRVLEVDDLSVDRFLAIVGAVFDFDAVGVESMQCSVVLFQAGMIGIGDDVHDIIDGGLRKIRIQSKEMANYKDAQQKSRNIKFAPNVFPLLTYAFIFPKENL